MASKDLVFRFLGVDAGASREFDRMAGKSKSLEHAVGALGVGMAAAAAGFAVESVKMAAKFQSSMELIHTQAGATQAEVQRMSKAILALAGPTATAPDTLTEGLYHLESAGFRGQKALNALRIAAEGAKIGGANLEDVTNALNATLVSGIKGSKDFSAAMGALNATVGAGDMRMQDLAEAMGTGVLAAVKGFGLSLNDVGAALATFGDNNIRGADAATQLRMAVLFMAKPAATAKKELAALGMTQSTLADDMRTKGLGGALLDLRKHLIAAGDTGAKMGQVLVELFGHRAGTGLAILEQQFGRFQLKQKEVAQGSRNFASDWGAYTQTFGYSWDRARSAFQSMTIELGTKLLPVATKAMNWIGTTGVQDLDKFGGWVSRNKGAIEDVAKALGAIAAFRLASGALINVGRLTGVLSRGVGGGGLLGGAASMAKPVPVYVTNQGFGAPGGGGIPPVAGGGERGGPLDRGGPLGIGGGVGGFVKSIPLYGVGANSDVHRNALSGSYGFTSADAKALRARGPQYTQAALQAYQSSVGMGLHPDPAKLAAWEKQWLATTVATASAGGAKTGTAYDAALAGRLRGRLASSGAARGAVSAIVKNAEQDAADGGEAVGGALMDGVVRGIDARKAAAIVGAGNATLQVIANMNKQANISSPSKKTTYIGQMLAAGLERGMHMGAKGVSDAARQLMGTVLGNFQASASLGNLGSQVDSLGAPGGQMTAAGITAFLRSQASQDKSYVRNLAVLRKKGVSSYLVQQIAQMEPTQGAPLAAALSHASAAQIRSINASERQVAAYGRQAGGIVTLSQDSINRIVHGLEHVQITTDSQRLSHRSAKKIRARA